MAATIAAAKGESGMESFASDLSRTLSLSNQYVMLMLADRGLEGLAPSHGDILTELFENETVSMSDLSHRISRNPSTVTVLVKKLVDMGLAYSEKSDSDRRQTMVGLTERGRCLERTFAEVSDKLNQPWHVGIDDEDLVVMSRVLMRVRGNLRDEIAHLQAAALSRQDRPCINETDLDAHREERR